MTTMSDDGDRTCPLCAEEMDLTDQQLKPCKCGYEICVWCWHHIMDMAEKDGSEGRCPACRTPYDKQRIVGMAANCKKMVAEISAEKKHKSVKTKNKTSSIEDRKHLSSVRVVQKNLVYIMGVPNSLADENILERKEYFGQYGRILKVSLSRPAGTTIQQASTNNTFNVYITYAREEEAIRCIQTVHNFVLEGKPLRACFGTTKYCYTWLRNMTCSNPECLYLHDIGSQEDSFTKDEIISAYTRSRVPQISSSNVQPRVGNLLPPPVDDLCSNGVVSSKHPTKGPVNNTTNQVKSSADSTGPRSTALPAGASWGLRISNSRPPAASIACSPNPPKQKTEIPNSTSSSSIISTTKQTSAWNDDVVMTSKIPEDKSTLLEPLKQGDGKDDLTKLSDSSSGSGPDAGNISRSAWEDDDVTGTKIPNGKLTVHTNEKSRDSEASSPSELLLDDALHSAWDDDLVTTSNCTGEKHIIHNDDEFRPSDILSKLKAFPNATQTSGVSVSSNDGEVPISIANTNRTNFVNPRGADCGSSSCYPDDYTHISAVANRNADSLCLSLASVNLDTHLGADQISSGQQPSLVVDHRLDGKIGTQNLRLDQSTTSVPMSSASVFPDTYSPNISNHLTSSSQNGDVGDKLFSHDRSFRIMGVNKTESVFLNGHKEEMLNSFVKSENKSQYPGTIYTDKELRLSSGLGIVPNTEKTANVDMEEKNIVSELFSSDFDPWDDSWSSANNFAKLLAQMSRQDEPSNLPSTLKSQNTNQSRFSFARQDNIQANLGNSSYRDIGQSPQLFSSIQESYGNSFGTGFPFSKFEGVNALGNNSSTILSDSMAGVTRAKASAPPGFSVPNRAPPPGFSSQERYDQAFNIPSENQLHGSSLQNQFQVHSTGSAGDVEFIDPAILAVGKGRLPLGVNNNSGLGSRSSYHQQFNSTESDPRIQLLMQQSLSSNQEPRITNHIGERFLQFDDAYISSRFPSQNPSSLSPFAQISSQQQPSHNLNSQWNGWTDMPIGNGMGVADALRSERFGLSNYFHVNEEPKFHLPSSSDMYNRAFGI